jgi:dTDP-4-dehydrorhamnose reductase
VDVVPGHHDLIPLTRQELDVGDHNAVMGTVAALRPELILGLGAFTSVDDNERDPARAFRDNAQGAHSLALAARACGAVLLHVSTDYVFDGTKGSAYDEVDVPNPISVYGRSKLAAERLVRAVTPEHFIVRTGYIFGGGKDRLSTQLGPLRDGGEAAGLADRRGSPTYVRHLAERLLPLALTHRYGTYHMGGPEPATWYDLLVACKRIGGLPGSVRAQGSAELDLPAPRPADSSLTSVLMQNLQVPPMPPLDEALADLLDR